MTGPAGYQISNQINSGPALEPTSGMADCSQYTETGALQKAYEIVQEHGLGSGWNCRGGGPGVAIGMSPRAGDL